MHSNNTGLIMNFSPTSELVHDISNGKMVILVDDEDRENEGDLVLAADYVTPEMINFMATHARGLICLTLTQERCEQLNLPLMVSRNGTELGTNFTLSIEAAEGVTTGISAADRARTVRAAVRRDATAADIVQPGHIFPLMAQPGGVLHRAGHTEAGCDLAHLAGLEPAAVIVEIMNEDGTMARRPDLEKFAEKHNLKIGSIADLIEYRMVNEKTVECLQSTLSQTAYGELNMSFYHDKVDDVVHTVIQKGEITEDSVPLVRVHQLNPAKDLLGLPSTGKWRLETALKTIGESDCGVLILLGKDIRSVDACQQIQWHLSDADNASKPAAQDTASGYKTIGSGSQVLRELGVQRMKLLSSPRRFNALSGFNLEIVEYIESP